MRAITSFSEAGHDLYGEKFLASWAVHSDIPLTVYSEGPEYPPHVTKNLWDVPGCKQFIAESYPTEDYRFDVKKFGRKAFAQLDALVDDDIVIWIDADVELHGPLTQEALRPRLGPYITFMNRPQFYPCTSFVAWNTAHPGHQRWYREYERMWRDRAVFMLPEWHDAYVFNWVREHTESESKDLCEGMQFRMKSENVFDKCFPGHHKKGSRKHGAKGG